MNKIEIECNLESKFCIGKCPKCAECKQHCNLFNQILKGLIVKEQKNGTYTE